MIPEEVEKLPLCLRCRQRYDATTVSYLGAPLVPNGFLIYNSRDERDECDADVCKDEDCPHA